MEVFLADDRSPDGTASVVARMFPATHIIEGSGRDYWAGGMRRSFAAALNVGFDFYLWLNDDTLLTNDAISRLLSAALLAEHSADNGAIVVGSISSASGALITYGGVNFPIWWRRTTPTIVYSDMDTVRCESFNGNCVLISSKAASIVGNLDPVFTHGLADFDYGLRASKLGVKLLVVAGIVGVCDRNPREGTYLDNKLSLAKRWRIVRSDKGYPPHPWAVYTRRHCGKLWILNWAIPYIRAIVAPTMKRNSPAVEKVSK